MDRSERGGYGRGREDDRGSSRERGRDRDDDRADRGRSRDRDDDRGGRSSSDRGRSGGYTYQRRDSEAAKKRAESGGKDFDTFVDSSVNFFKAHDGINTVRFLPPTWDDAQHYGVDIHVHYGVGADRQTYLCLNKMKGEKCPICEERAEAVRQGDDAYAKDLAPTRRVLVYLIDRDNEKDGVLAWAMPQNLDRDVVKVSTDRRSGEVLPIDHPDDGYDVIFEKKGAKMRTEYLGVQVDRRDSPLGKDAWLEYAQDKPLPSILQYYSYEHIKGVFTGGGVSRGDDGGGKRDREERDRDDDRSRDRDRGRDRDDGRDRDRGRDREREDARSSRDDRGSRGRSDEPTWDSVHAMRPRELEALIDEMRLPINPKEAKDDADLADWICEELKLKKPAEPAREERTSRERVRTDDRGGERDEVDEKLERMRSRRD